MSPDDYLLLATTVALLVFFVALAASGGSPKKTAEASKVITRWKRYRVHPDVVNRPSKASPTIVEEEPKGLTIDGLPTSSPHGLRASRPDGTGTMDVVRKWDFGRWRFRVRIDGKLRFVVLVPKRDRTKLSIDRLDGGTQLRLRGSPADREYEILEDGRLAAIVSWQRKPKEKAEPKSHYVVEVDKSTDDLPLLALVLAVEKAMA